MDTYSSMRRDVNGYIAAHLDNIDSDFLLECVGAFLGDHFFQDKAQDVFLRHIRSAHSGLDAHVHRHLPEGLTPEHCIK